MDKAHLIAIVNVDPFDPLPERIENVRSSQLSHAPRRNAPLNEAEKRLAVANALRYVPARHHEELAGEFLQELKNYGHIYAYRFMPAHSLNALPLAEIPGRSRHAAGIIFMILNNLDPAVAQYPQELVTYGGNGQVFANWIQFRLTLRYLNEMSDTQTLSLHSAHPHGLFPSNEWSPRLVITNGMMIPSYSTKANYDKYFALNVTSYGQMTAGSFCYIGPQGIVHGTTITIINAGRKYLNIDGAELAGKTFVTAGLGGMSGAQAKAAVIAGCIGVIAEIDESALRKRHSQGWLQKWSDNLDEIIALIKEHRRKKEPTSIGYRGNVVDLWERLAEESEMLVELGSDQTSCHNVHGGGYFPVGLSQEESNTMISSDPKRFAEFVKKSLCRHIEAIGKLARRGMHFFDYGNSFLLECHRAGADVLAADANDDKTFIFPSYCQDIMGDIFSVCLRFCSGNFAPRFAVIRGAKVALGFGPFRWVCASNDAEDLRVTDEIAAEVLERLLKKADALTRPQYQDNLQWIRAAQKHKLVVGSQARILYSDHEGRIEIALAFNAAVRDGRLKAPVIISRDHHDVSGTDSPFRETSDVIDGSAYTADMAVQNVIGDSFRGATWISLHNGGGVGWGDVINGGFGMMLDGSEMADKRASLMLTFDVSNGVARRSWSGNENARATILKTMQRVANLKVTVPEHVDTTLLERLNI